MGYMNGNMGMGYNNGYGGNMNMLGGQYGNTMSGNYYPPYSSGANGYNQQYNTQQYNNGTQQNNNQQYNNQNNRVPTGR